MCDLEREVGLGETEIHPAFSVSRLGVGALQQGQTQPAAGFLQAEFYGDRAMAPRLHTVCAASQLQWPIE